MCCENQYMDTICNLKRAKTIKLSMNRAITVRAPSCCCELSVTVFIYIFGSNMLTWRTRAVVYKLPYDPSSLRSASTWWSALCMTSRPAWRVAPLQDSAMDTIQASSEICTHTHTVYDLYSAGIYLALGWYLLTKKRNTLTALYGL